MSIGEGIAFLLIFWGVMMVVLAGIDLWSRKRRRVEKSQAEQAEKQREAKI